MVFQKFKNLCQTFKKFSFFFKKVILLLKIERYKDSSGITSTSSQDLKTEAKKPTHTHKHTPPKQRGKKSTQLHKDRRTDACLF